MYYTPAGYIIYCRTERIRLKSLVLHLRMVNGREFVWLSGVSRISQAQQSHIATWASNAKRVGSLPMHLSLSCGYVSDTATTTYFLHYNFHIHSHTIWEEVVRKTERLKVTFPANTLTQSSCKSARFDKSKTKTASNGALAARLDRLYLLCEDMNVVTGKTRSKKPSSAKRVFFLWITRAIKQASRPRAGVTLHTDTDRKASNSLDPHQFRLCATQVIMNKYSGWVKKHLLSGEIRTVWVRITFHFPLYILPLCKVKISFRNKKRKTLQY